MPLDNLEGQKLWEQFLEQYDFRWDILDVVVGGRSALDAPNGFPVFNLESAERVLTAYGFDSDNPIENAHLLGNFQESLNFIRKYFLKPENPDGLAIEVPRKILELTDVRELFLMASRSTAQQQPVLRNWACSLLKVMHTIAHIDQDIRTSYFGDVQKQIFDRYYRMIHRDEHGNLYIGESADDPLRVNFHAFETKPKKSRDSTLIKLLHKPENVADDIFDRVGIRFVTHTKVDTLKITRFLKDRMVILPTNIKPSRSRNTLINVQAFRKEIEDARARPFDGANDLEQYKADWVQRLESVSTEMANQSSAENPHTSEHYRAIQFTCRQLIKLKNPTHEAIREVQSQSRQPGCPESLKSAIDRIDLRFIQREVRFFYPYEVQLLDLESANENERGKSAHSEYKKSQVQTALKRVMGPLVDAGA